MKPRIVSRSLLLALCVAALPICLAAQTTIAEQVQVGPPPLRRAEPPAAGATAAELEKQGDDLRGEKAFLDAIDYFRAALKKDGPNARIYNKVGIAELQLLRPKEARKDFEAAIRNDRQYAEAYNNLGTAYHYEKNFGKAIKQYRKAIALRDDSATFFVNLGAAYFSKKDYQQAMQAYARAIQLDPEVFEHTGRTGVTLQVQTREERARYSYLLARMYAKMGLIDRSLLCLKRAMEDGFPEMKKVYEDEEFTELRKDPRFTELMAAKPVAIPE
jgi:tetratricopeptide (TPR) repeat protein